MWSVGESGWSWQDRIAVAKGYRQYSYGKNKKGLILRVAGLKLPFFALLGELRQVKKVGKSI